MAGLSQGLLQSWQVGLGAFQRPATPPGGLGPVFTENACAKCHNAAAPGGAGPRLVTHIGRIVNGQFDPMVAFGGPTIQDRGIGPFNGVNFVGEVVPPQATIVAHHRTIPTFGLGLVDAVPDSTFIALAQHEAQVSPLTAGTPSLVPDPVSGQTRVGKFGWKAQEPTVLAFSADASVNEMGVTSPIFPSENCPQGNCALLAANPARTNPNDFNGQFVQQVTEFVALLAPAPRGPAGANEQAGGTIFTQIGCASCHTPSLQTGPNPVPALSDVAFSPYSDFLLHDMGSLGDGIVQNHAGPTQMRTAPLWGVRFEPSYLHDGRASTLDQAIRAHAGQGLAARNNYVALSATQQAQLIDFLNSL
ncbi:MAG: di-heme oxidoredictase family protein [Isosphaeraceae bacterium]|nr:di-heme oxidoredictase family protein [Isosphaeraceae bacterium]